VVPVEFNGTSMKNNKALGEKKKPIYRVIREETSIVWEVTVLVNVRKKIMFTFLIL
jgi:hypothetical protein